MLLLVSNVDDIPKERFGLVKIVKNYRDNFGCDIFGEERGKCRMIRDLIGADTTPIRGAMK